MENVSRPVHFHLKSLLDNSSFATSKEQKSSAISAGDGKTGCRDEVMLCSPYGERLRVCKERILRDTVRDETSSRFTIPVRMGSNECLRFDPPWIKHPEDGTVNQVKNQCCDQIFGAWFQVECRILCVIRSTKTEESPADDRTVHHHHE